MADFPFKVGDPVFVYINGQKDRPASVQYVNELAGTIVVDGSCYEVNREMREAYLTSQEGYSAFSPARRKPRKNYFKVAKATEAEIKDFLRRTDFNERRDLYDHSV